MESRPTGITRRGLMGAMGGALAGGALVANVADATGITERRDAYGRPLDGPDKQENEVGALTAPVID